MKYSARAEYEIKFAHTPQRISYLNTNISQQRYFFCKANFIKKRVPKWYSFFIGGEDGILLLLSKGALHLSPKFFRLTPQNLEPRIRIPIYTNKKRVSKMILFFYWRRGWDSNPCGFWPNGFQDRLVMTASIPLRICSNILSQEYAVVKNFLKKFRSDVSHCGCKTIF